MSSFNAVSPCHILVPSLCCVPVSHPGAISAPSLHVTSLPCPHVVPLCHVPTLDLHVVPCPTSLRRVLVPHSRAMSLCHLPCHMPTSHLCTVPPPCHVPTSHLRATSLCHLVVPLCRLSVSRPRSVPTLSSSIPSHPCATSPCHLRAHIPMSHPQAVPLCHVPAPHPCTTSPCHICKPHPAVPCPVSHPSVPRPRVASQCAASPHCVPGSHPSVSRPRVTSWCHVPVTSLASAPPPGPVPIPVPTRGPRTGVGDGDSGSRARKPRSCWPRGKLRHGPPEGGTWKGHGRPPAPAL